MAMAKVSCLSAHLAFFVALILALVSADLGFLNFERIASL